ncbi:MAG: hypothetical protein WD360_05905 [Nitriliruptoraceae bacterium]
MKSQRDALRAFFTERARGVAAIIALAFAVSAVGLAMSALIVWLLA